MKIRYQRILLTLFVPIFLIAEEGGTSLPEVPTVSEITGQVNRYDEVSGGFAPVQVGEKISDTTLYFMGADSELIISYPAKIVPRFGENTRAVVEPEEDGCDEVNLQLGTVTALLDSKGDKGK